MKANWTKLHSEYVRIKESNVEKNNRHQIATKLIAEITGLYDRALEKVNTKFKHSVESRSILNLCRETIDQAQRDIQSLHQKMNQPTKDLERLTAKENDIQRRILEVANRINKHNSSENLQSKLKK